MSTSINRFLGLQILPIAVAGLAGIQASLWPERAFAATSVVIELNDTATGDDDYLCWAPVPARIRLTASTSTSATVVLQSDGATGGGAVRFLPDSGSKPTPASFNPAPQLSVSVPANGTWTRFWVVGWRASNAAKDVRIVATAGGAPAGDVLAMVRVRKDAETLSPEEIRKFLQAVATVHRLNSNGLGSQWVKHVRAHEDAFFTGIHGTPLFGVSGGAQESAAPPSAGAAPPGSPQDKPRSAGLSCAVEDSPFKPSPPAPPAAVRSAGRTGPG